MVKGLRLKHLKDEERSRLTIRALYLSCQTQLILETFLAKVAQSQVLSCLLYGMVQGGHLCRYLSTINSYFLGI